MKNILKKGVCFLITLSLIFSVGVSNFKNVLADVYTTIYLEVGEKYVINISSNKPVLDAYGDLDKEVAPAVWNSSNLDKRDSLTITAKTVGTAIYYVCKNNNVANDNRVRTIRVYVYAKASNTTLNITNSTSTTNNSRVNQTVYLYTSKTSNCTASQTNSFPASVGADTSGKAKALSTTWVSSNTQVATVSNYGVINGVKQGYSTITCTRSWTTSCGNVRKITRSIGVYVYTMPILTIYEGVDAITSKTLNTSQKVTLTYKLSGMQATDTIKSVKCTPADSNKFSVASKDGEYIIDPKTVTNGAVNAIFEVVLNSNVAKYNGTAAATFTKTIPINIIEDSNIYVTSIDFSKKSISIVKGEVLNNEPHILPVDATDKTVDYKSTNISIATVDENGNVEGNGCGNTNIIATSRQIPGVSGYYSLTVIEKPVKINDVINVGDGIKLEWSINDNAKEYLIYRSVEKNGSYTNIGKTTGTTYTDKTGLYGSKYYYKIVVVPKEGDKYSSDYSNIVSIKRELNAPTIISIKKVYGQYQVKMSVSGECDGYVVYSGMTNRDILVSVNSNVATISLTEGTYYISARSYVLQNKEKVYSAYSEIKEVVVTSEKTTVITVSDNKKYKPGKTFIEKIKGKKKAFTLKLKKVKNVTRYQVKYSTSRKFAKKDTKIKNIKRVNYTIKKLKSKKKYYVKVRTYRKIKGVKYYSRFSKVKAVRVK